MLRHVVLMKFVPEATAEQRQAVEDGLAALPAQIPELRSYVIGTDVGASEGNFDFAVVADLDDVDAFRPIHRPPGAQVRRRRADPPDPGRPRCGAVRGSRPIA